MRFSVWPTPVQPWVDVLDLVTHCEATGWDGAWFADHFMPLSEDGRPVGGPMLECWAVLAGLAVRTERIRLGPLVCGNTYRHPAVLANIAGSVDQLSNGRLVLGLGAGWQENEHIAYGIPLPGVRERLDRLEEACQVVLGLLRSERTTFVGEHYQLEDAPCEPRPVQPRLPLLIGGAGERRTMRIAARYADEWNVWGTPELLRHKIGVLERHCEELGRDPGTIRRSANAVLFLSNDRQWLANRGEVGRDRPVIVGTPREVVETVAAYREAGVDELILPDFAMGSMSRRKDTYDLFQEEVASQFRA